MTNPKFQFSSSKVTYFYNHSMKEKKNVIKGRKKRCEKPDIFACVKSTLGSYRAYYFDQSVLFIFLYHAQMIHAGIRLSRVEIGLSTKE